MSFKKFQPAHPLILRAVIFIAAIACCFYPSLTAEKTVSPDAYFLLPYLNKINNLTEYFFQLFSLQAFDIQPVRDLSLWIDWMIFHKWGTNVFIIHNAILWLVSGFLISKIIELENPKLSPLRSTFYVGTFLSYPLFAHIISFSMARKHILAFMFIMFATYYFLLFIKNYQWKYGLLFSLSYLLAVFSQPICLLWPLWVVIYQYTYKKNEFKKFIPYLFILSVIFLLGFSANYIYYEKSVFFQSIFGSKTKHALLIWPKFLSMGHYLFNIFFPYKLVFYYEIKTERVIWGAIFFLLFSFFYLLRTKNFKKYFIWICFSFFPLGIILNTPNLLFDVYLLLPCLGFFVLFVDLISTLSKRSGLLIGLTILIFFMFFTHQESQLWTNSRLWGESGFKRSPSCNGTVRYAREILSNGEVPEKEILNYIFQNNCFRYESTYNKLEIIVFESQLIFHDQNLTLDQKKSYLEEHGKFNFYPLIILAGIYIRNNLYDEARKTIDHTVNYLGNVKLETTYDAIFDKIVLPYCQRIEHSGCIRITSPLTVRHDVPYL
jgi:hypothetical protein